LSDLKRIKAVDPVHEFGAIAYHSLLKKGRLFFENIKGHSTPFANVLSTGRKVGVALGIEVDKRMMIEKFLSGFQNPIESVVVKAGPSKEEIHKQDDVDREKFFMPVWHAPRPISTSGTISGGASIRVASRTATSGSRCHANTVGINPWFKQEFTSRIAIDATSKFKGIEFPEVNSVSRELSHNVLSRWAELGLE
jgi:hypothetical protein